MSGKPDLLITFFAQRFVFNGLFALSRRETMTPRDYFMIREGAKTDLANVQLPQLR